MAIRFPSVLHAKQILRQLQLLTNQAATASVSRDVPKGYLVVYVGERSQKKRFIIPVVWGVYFDKASHDEQVSGSRIP